MTANVDPDLVIYSTGVCFTSVCTTLTDDDAIAHRVNMELPTGISSRWAVSDEPFSDDTPNGAVCPDDDARRHVLLEC